MKALAIVVASTALGALALAAPAPAQKTRSYETFQTTAGEVKVTAIYHATAMIEGGGKVIYIDPAKPADFTGLPKADLILITHEHPDHVDQDLTSIKAISKEGTKIWAPEAVAKFVPNATIVYNGEVRRTDKTGWLIEAIPAYNIKRGPAPGQLYHPKDEGNGYVLSLGGVRIYFSGDTEATPEMKALRNITVAFLCMNMPYTMTPEEAADAVKIFKPKIAAPYHFRATPPTNLVAFRERLASTGIEVRTLVWYPEN